MKIMVMGIGALGTVYSCLLKEQGHYVVGLDREEIANIIKANGVKVSGIWGDHHSYLDQVVTSAEQLETRDLDLIIVTVKSFDTAAVAAGLKHLLGDHTYLLLAQNGYGNYEAAAQYIPKDRLILGRVIFGSETVSPGVARVTVIADDVRIGSPEQLIPLSVLEEMADVFSQAGIPTQAAPEIMKFVWGKIIYNSALNPLGAILEVNYGRLAEDQHSHALMDHIIMEIFEVLKALKQETFWPDAQAYMKDFYSQMVPSTAGHHASMLQDIQRGRRTEIDALNGAIIELGKSLQVSTPVNETITRLIKFKERQ